MMKIVPCLWFDSQAEEAARFYASIFKRSEIGAISRYGKVGFEVHGRPAGSVLTVEFELDGQRFTALNGGPAFKFNPSASFLIACETKAEVDAFWAKLIEGGSALMELGRYPFSERYGWLHDRYGLSWQVMFMGPRRITQKITPTLMFVGEQCGNAEQAIKFYASVFEHSKAGDILRYGRNESPDKEGTIKHAEFSLEGRGFAAMDSAHDHKFAFNEAVSFQIYCKAQEEADRYWDKLSAGGDKTAQQCGWLKDRYGLSWQIVPEFLGEMIGNGDTAATDRIMEVLRPMKKLDFAALMKAYERS